MPKFVRCMEGHAFDSEQSEVCPTCGASVWRGVADVKPKPARVRVEGSADDGPRPGRDKWLMAGGGGICVIAAAVVGYVLLRPVAPPPAPAIALHSQITPPEQSAPTAVTAQTQPTQPAVVATAEKPAPPAGGQTSKPQPPDTGQAVPPPATVTQVKPPPSGGGGQAAPPSPLSLAVVAPPAPPASTVAPPAALTSPVPAPQPGPVVTTPPGPAPVQPPAIPCGSCSSDSAPPGPPPAPSPPVIATELSGRAHFAQHSLAILDVDGMPVRLLGVVSQGGDRQRDAAERFLSYITQGTNQVRCEPQGDKTYECRAVRTDVRIGAGVIANGFAAADPAGPAEFQHWEDDARRAHRGIWSAQANR